MHDTNYTYRWNAAETAEVELLATCLLDASYSALDIAYVRSMSVMCVVGGARRVGPPPSKNS